jgi:hypothetical protein
VSYEKKFRTSSVEVGRTTGGGAHPLALFSKKRMIPVPTFLYFLLPFPAKASLAKLPIVQTHPLVKIQLTITSHNTYSFEAFYFKAEMEVIVMCLLS